jgi:hypothetical protein
MIMQSLNRWLRQTLDRQQRKGPNASKHGAQRIKGGCHRVHGLPLSISEIAIRAGDVSSWATQ